MTPDEFLTKAKCAASDAGHPWPEYAACEAALESNWGKSGLAIRGNNLFGQKHGFTTSEWPSLDMPTWEVIKGVRIATTAKFAKFPDWATCFKERHELLQRKSAYAPALKAETGVDFVRLVSKVWATDPDRADKVLRIHGSHFPSITVQENA